MLGLHALALGRVLRRCIFTVVTATFKVRYVLVVVEHATRRILHFNVTRHPTGDWTLQQLRAAIPGITRTDT
jgi:hypothetical protein